jgi:Ca2+/H+ antiporter, TMEM165/GDT1 family
MRNCNVLLHGVAVLALAVSLSGTVAGQGTGAAAIGGTATTGAAAAAAGVGNDWFNTIDANHDGSIDRQEYNQGMLKLDAIFKGPLAAAKAMMMTGDSSNNNNNNSNSAVYSFFASLAHGSFWKGFTSGVAMILATEIGDKTFFIAAVLSMRHDRSAVFTGAIVALIIMTILSSAMGLVLPQFVDRQYTHILGGMLFLYFGVKLLYESKQMEANRVSEELEEVEEELLHPKKDDKEQPDEEDPPLSTHSSKSKATNMKNSSNHPQLWYQVCLQSLTLTFLAEWGDRSQIATIALAAAKNPYGVTVGGCLGHCCCTGLAVMGGRMLAARISEKSVSFWGGIIFLVFGLHSIFMES